MQIQKNINPQPKTLGGKSNGANKPELNPEPRETFWQSYGVELTTGGFVGAVGAVPALGAMSNWNVGLGLLKEKEDGRGLSHFEMAAGLTALGCGAANVAGTIALFQGQAQLGLALLAGGGLVTGTIAALGMDGGSLASRLGLQN
ncbi:MAG: hypothetical protein U0931_16305 [Vulcanimicrobiota bacterium]